MVFLFYYRLECQKRSSEQILPPGTKYERSIPGDVQTPNTVRTLTVSCALSDLL